jgi:putative signal transducing protein
MFGRKKPSSDLSPRFCQGCGLDDFDNFAGSLCPECGDSLLAKGYCPVCEKHLPQVPGSLCPKHDLELEESAPEQTVRVEDGTYVPWVTVSVFPNSVTAAILQSRLEAEGIPTILDGERMGAAGMYLAAVRGVRLQVPEDRVTDARIILSQNWSLPDDEKADFEDLL